MVDKNIAILAILRQYFNLSAKGDHLICEVEWKKYMAVLPETDLNKVKHWKKMLRRITQTATSQSFKILASSKIQYLNYNFNNVDVNSR